MVRDGSDAGNPQGPNTGEKGGNKLASVQKPSWTSSTPDGGNSITVDVIKEYRIKSLGGANITVSHREGKREFQIYCYGWAMAGEIGQLISLLDGLLRKG